MNTLKKLFIINFFTLFIMIIIGFICSHKFGEIVPFPLIDNSLRIDNPARDFLFILKNNLFLVIHLLLGATTFGVLSIILFGWNAFFLGTGISSIVDLNGMTYISAYVYIFFEFLSLTFAVTAGEKIGVDSFGYLLGTRRPKDLFITFLISLIF